MKKDIIKVVVSAVLLIVIYFLPINELAKLLCYLVPYIICGYETIIGAVKGIANKELLDEKFLMTIATIGAFAIGEYPEAVFVMLFYQVGEIFEDLAVEKSRKSITELVDYKEEIATVERDGKVTGIKPEKIEIGDIIIVKPGEKIPVDGTIIEGETSLNNMVITGESLPQSAGVGSQVYGGSINEEGLVKVKATKKLAESTSTKILRLVEDAQENQAGSERFITRFARVYTPVVVGLAVLIAVIPSIILGDFSVWFERALLFLVVSCPCALVISVPLAFFAGIGGASKKGILVKGANYLEDLKNIRIMALDKTGTLTEGVFEVIKVKPNGITDVELVTLAATAEKNSNHPIAVSLRSEYKKRTGKDITEEATITDLPGKGISATIGKDKDTYYVGTAKLMDEVGAEYEEADIVGTAVYVAKNHEYLGYVICADKVKEQAKKDVERIRQCGVSKIVMLTGDKKNVAEQVGSEVGVDEIYAECLPEDKIDNLKKASGEIQGKSSFVGDGINDAPVIATADVGIAMGAMGQDAAIEAADVVLMEDKLSKISTAIKISKKTNRIVWANIIFALGIKVLVMILGAFGMAEMWHAVFADVGVTVIAILNSMRALRIKEKE